MMDARWERALGLGDEPRVEFSRGGLLTRRLGHPPHPQPVQHVNAEARSLLQGHCTGSAGVWQAVA
jgi:hypothetical protein